MNAKEQFKKTASLMNMQREKPSEEQITGTIETLSLLLQLKSIGKAINAPVREGYKKAVEVLELKQFDFNSVDVSELHTTQGRAIAAMAFDYLNGLCTQETLCGVPIKD